MIKKWFEKYVLDLTQEYNDLFREHVRDRITGEMPEDTYRYQVIEVILAWQEIKLAILHEILGKL